MILMITGQPVEIYREYAILPEQQLTVSTYMRRYNGFFGIYKESNSISQARF
jgi:hypothetical protein